MYFATKQWKDLDTLRHVKAIFSPKRKQSTTTDFTVLEHLHGRSLTILLVTCVVKSRTMTTLDKRLSNTSLGNNTEFCAIPP